MQWPKFALVLGANSVFELAVILSRVTGKNKLEAMFVIEIDISNEDSAGNSTKKEKKRRIKLSYETNTSVKEKVRDCENNFYEFREIVFEEVMEIFNDKINIKQNDKSKSTMQEIASAIINKRI